MKKRIIIVLSLIFVFGLFVTAFVFDKTNSAADKTVTECPLNSNAPAQSAETMDMSKVTVVKSDEDCCHKGADCCKGGSCCHKKS